ncbi:VWA domain-containing protein [Paenibacillus nanensis]|uniref:VWA domain-containing protein n=1 Tax=Paenibacillus nanensis TaxID=393251 RepID=A0A3A1UPH0_9BACL|nr:VWA domain-containing protein [Paenibacillus nanensis]RIX50254.1 VWA domain-containing protein [Paenibacillus nanensis]
MYSVSKVIVAACLIGAMLIAGCSKNDEPDAEKPTISESPTPEQLSSANEDKQLQEPDQLESFLAEWEKLPPIPSTITEFIEYPVGRFKGIEEVEGNAEVEAFLAELPVLPVDASTRDVELYFTYIYSLFKPDLPDPRDISVEYDKSLPDGADPITPELQKDAYNVEIVLDASGSMAETIDGQTRMELAKEAIAAFLSSLPEGANVGLRVYGHKGTGSNKDRELSCAANELVYEVKPYDRPELDDALDSFKPAGWTPLSKAIELANSDLSEFEGDNNRNILYIVSDGIETCGGDPVRSAELLKQSDVNPIVNIIGFDVDDEGQKQLKEVAEAAGGTYTDVNNQDELKAQFEQSREEALKWHNWYLESRGKALETRGDHFDQIIDWRDEFTDKMNVSYGAYLDSINFLSGADKINGDQRDVMLDYYGQLRDHEMDEYERVSDELFELQDLEFEEAYKRIEEIFGSKQQ